ncbi:MAG: pseudouridine synthase, partial [Planctomycetota bacterium]
MNAHPLLQKLIPILYEDEHFLAIGKPAGVDVGGLPNERGTGLVELVQTLRGRNETLHPANRLSRFESGVLLLGKNPGAAARIRTMLKSFRLDQEYVAVVNGRMNKAMLFLDSRRDPAEKKVAKGKRLTRNPRIAKRTAPSAAPAIRTVLRRIEQGEHRTLIRCETTAPTTHALRAQLRSVGLRLVGDRVHDRAPRLMAHEDTCLHLSRVRLPGARLESRTSGQKDSMTIRSPASAGFAVALRGERDVQRLLHAALTRRLPCLLEPKTDSCRLLTGPAEGLSGLIAEKYGPVVVLQVLEASPRWLEALPDIARWYRDLLRVRAVYVKRFVRDRTQLNDDLQEALRSPKPLLGEPAPSQVEILERGL